MNVLLCTYHRRQVIFKYVNSYSLIKNNQHSLKKVFIWDTQEKQPNFIKYLTYQRFFIFPQVKH